MLFLSEPVFLGLVYFQPVAGLKGIQRSVSVDSQKSGYQPEVAHENADVAEQKEEQARQQQNITQPPVIDRFGFGLHRFLNSSRDTQTISRQCHN